MVAARFAEILYLAVREAIERMPDARIERATDARPRCSRNTRRATGRFMGACRNGTVRTFQHGAPGPSRRSGRSSVRDYRSERRRHRRVLDAAQVSEYRRSCCAHPPRFEAVDWMHGREMSVPVKQAYRWIQRVPQCAHPVGRRTTTQSRSIRHFRGQMWS